MRARDYVDEVMQYVDADASIKKRLSEDLYEHIEAAGGDDAINRMGDPKDMAAELMDAIYTDKSEVIRELVRTRTALKNSVGSYEYISKRKLFGLPLVHIRYGRGFSLKPAKGIIAIGNTAVGVIAIGGFSAGLLSVGGFSFGLLASLGGISVGSLALGGLAAGLVAIGGLAAGMYAFGGLAVASHIAVGGWASAEVAIGGTAQGTYTIATGGTSLNASAVSKREALALIAQAFPNTPDIIERLFTLAFK